MDVEKPVESSAPTCDHCGAPLVLGNREVYSDGSVLERWDGCSAKCQESRGNAPVRVAHPHHRPSPPTPLLETPLEQALDAINVLETDSRAQYRRILRLEGILSHVVRTLIPSIRGHVDRQMDRYMNHGNAIRGLREGHRILRSTLDGVRSDVRVLRDLLVKQESRDLLNESLMSAQERNHADVLYLDERLRKLEGKGKEGE